MPHCSIHPIYNPSCHDCREASLTHTTSLLDDDDLPSAASILLTSESAFTPTFDSTPADTPAPDFDFGGGDSGGGGTSGDF